MRVLGGKLKGRNIEVSPGIRPVSQRVKKSCFDILFGETEAKKVLDLYAGSGSLGIEALSRGASQAAFVDKDKASLKSINKNIKGLGLEQQAKVYSKEVYSAIKDFHRKRNVFDTIFLDPPYYRGL